MSELDKPSCFVIMPIKKEGTEEFRHFKAIYDNFLKPELTSLGFDVVRADEVYKGGAITKDIIVKLANADLVVADLTDLNPNVFYELGARHALRGVGTIMLLDESKTPVIPFDLSAYRVVKFSGDVVGIGSLRSQLGEFVTEMRQSGSHLDNPIHDWLPWLPINAVERSTKTEESKLRSVIVEMRSQIKRYETSFGLLSDNKIADDKDPLQIIEAAKLEADDGNLPIKIVEKSRLAAARGDITTFLEAVQQAFRTTTFPLSPNEFMELSRLSERFGSSTIRDAIYVFARRKYPNNNLLRKAQLAGFAHSEDPKDRLRAREEIGEMLGLRFDNGEITFSSGRLDDPIMFGIMLDAYSSDHLEAEALNLTTSAIKQFPDNSHLLRNHAKFLISNGMEDEGLDFHKQAVRADPHSDVALIWYGSELHNRGRRVDALEAYLLACLNDPDDAANFGHVADEISTSVGYRLDRNNKLVDRLLPESITDDDVVMAVRAAWSCESGIAGSREYIDRALRKLRGRTSGKQPDVEQEGKVSYGERCEWAARLYDLLKSEITLS